MEYARAARQRRLCHYINYVCSTTKNGHDGIRIIITMTQTELFIIAAPAFVCGQWQWLPRSDKFMNKANELCAIGDNGLQCKKTEFLRSTIYSKLIKEE